MKKLIIILVLLAAVDLGATYYVGKQAEKSYLKTINLLDNTPGIQAKVISFERGFFTSNVVTEIVVGKSTYDIHDTIIHGPLAIDFKQPSRTRFALGVVQSTIQTPSFNVPVFAEVIFPFTGGAKLVSKGEAFQFKDQSLLLMEGTGWDTKGEVNSQFDTYTFQNRIPTINIINKALGEKDKTQIKDMILDIDYQKNHTADNLKVTYTIANISNPGQILELNNLKLDAGLLLKPESFDSFIKAEFSKLVVKDENIGPCKLLLKIENVDKALYDLVKKLGLNKPASSKEIQDVMKIVFKRGFLIEVDNMEATVPEGQFLLKGKLNVGGPELKEPLNADNVLSGSQGDIYISMPKQVFRDLLKNNASFKMAKDPAYKALSPEEQQQKLDAEINRITDTLKNSQIVTETDQANIIKFSFSQGRIMVEGKEVPKPELLN